MASMAQLAYGGYQRGCASNNVSCISLRLLWRQAGVAVAATSVWRFLQQ
jgi:hypothetical protein